MKIKENIDLNEGSFPWLLNRITSI